MSVTITISNAVYHHLERMSKDFTPITSSDVFSKIALCSKEQSFEVGEEYGQKFLADVILASAKAQSKL
jgi:predicted CopG family antitoxin